MLEAKFGDDLLTLNILLLLTWVMFEPFQIDVSFFMIIAFV